jgi:dTDP-4-amino-4,6-dideoxygalactose transaminase
MIRLALPDIDESDIEAISAVLRSGRLVQGENVREFELRLAALVGVKQAIVVSSCTAALQLAFGALGLEPGDEIAVPTYSWPATANVVELCGAVPRFVDINPITWNMDVERLKECLASSPRVRAVVPVHAFGRAVEVEAIATLAAEYRIPVIEDAACALGARSHGRPLGSWGRCGCFSFHPRKVITTGEGGVIATSDEELAVRLRAARNHGLDPRSPRPEFILPGTNCRMTDLQAALGLSQLNKLERLLAKRRRAALLYDALLQGSGLPRPDSGVEGEHVYQAYVVLLPEAKAGRRDDTVRRMAERGIEIAIGTHHIPLVQYYRDKYKYRVGDFPVTDSVAARAIALPLHTSLTSDDQSRVISELLAVLTL